MGARRPVHFSEPQPPAFDAWDAKSLAEVMARAAHPAATITLVPGDGAVLWQIEADAVRIGRVERITLDAPVWAKPAFGVELLLGDVHNVPVAAPSTNVHDVAPVPATHREPVRYRALPTTPAAEFDLALLVPDAVAAGAVERVLREVSGAQLERLELFDEFRGAGVPEGTRSLAWRLTFRHPERTLRDKEIEGRRVQLLKSVEAQLGVRARTN